MENKNQNTVLYIANIAIRLIIICAVIAALVATVNKFASPVIEENTRKETAAAIEAIFEEGVVPEEIAVPDDADDSVDTLYSISKGGKSIGYCVKLSPMCFKGDVDMIVGIENGVVRNVVITSTNDETSGIGTKVQDESFTSKFISRAFADISEANMKEYTISGATKTSKPVTLAVKAALGTVELLGQRDNTEEVQD